MEFARFAGADAKFTLRSSVCCPASQNPHWFSASPVSKTEIRSAFRRLPLRILRFALRFRICWSGSQDSQLSFLKRRERVPLQWVPARYSGQTPAHLTVFSDK